MVLSQSAVETAAPDQASLKAAIKLLTPAKWPERAQTEGLIWGACQGSGANPYRVAVDLSDLGAKCSCPSRKFPCKHALALMLQYAEAPDDFGEAAIPDWVTEWLGRRRKTAAPKPGDAPSGPKSLAAAKIAEPEAAPDPKAEAKREAARLKRAEATRTDITDGMEDLERWVADQLRTGLSELLGDLHARCRRIASRLVDAKAGSLAARIDGLPARILALPQDTRADALISELGKLVIITRAWGDGQDAPPALRREITGAEQREALLEDSSALRQTGPWEVLATREENRRDGLIARSTWLLFLQKDGPDFALLQDFYPASTGKQGSAFSPGEQFEAEVIFYPADVPLRAQIVERKPLDIRQSWPAKPAAEDTLHPFAAALTAEPWLQELPLLLPPGSIAETTASLWWAGTGEAALPLKPAMIDRALRGTDLTGTAILWNGHQADLLAANTTLGLFHADG